MTWRSQFRLEGHTYTTLLSARPVLTLAMLSAMPVVGLLGLATQQRYNDEKVECCVQRRG
jgi:hypothetical protein